MQIELFQSSATGILSVTQITQYLCALLESDEILQNIWVQGEISNLSLPTSGHIYFTLKDETASLRCVIWKNAAFSLRAHLQEGAAVEAHGAISIYERSGQYQLYVDDIRPAGEGALYQEFLRLKSRLEAEGLFAAERKRPIPAFPELIGIVTSASGAALQDMLNILRVRFPLAEVVLAPTAVQGDDAPPQIVKALEQVNQLAKPDVILLARGGGSLEDLWAFNDERVVRAVVASRSPVITGIGHETDFTLADFAADLRAPTPTGAAVQATPDIADLSTELNSIVMRLVNQFQVELTNRGNALQTAELGLEKYSPIWKLRQEMQQVDEFNLRLVSLISNRIQFEKMRLEQINGRIQSLDPLQVLRRGFAMVSDEQGAVVDSVRKVIPDQQVRVLLQDGRFSANVKEIEAQR